MMKYWKDMAFGLLASLTLASCYGEEDSFATPSIYKDYQPVLNDGNTLTGYGAAPLKEAKYDETLNELYITWDGGNTGWEKRNEYVGAEVEFNSLLSGKKIKRVMIPNVGDFGNLIVKKRDYNNELSTLRLSKYRTVVVTDRYGVAELRFRSIYKDAEGTQKTSEWMKLSDQVNKAELTVDMSYSAWQYFKSSQVTPVQILFESNSTIRPVSAIWDVAGSGSEASAKEEFQKWYYMDCAAMSFDPYNMAFDPYTKLYLQVKKEQTGGAYAIDYPSHNEGRGIVYPAAENDLNSNWWKLSDMRNVLMHEMGHCVEWMPARGKYIIPNVQDCDKQGYQEGWPDAVKLASKGYDLDTQKSEYQAALAKPYADPQSDKKFVWQIDYNTSGAFMSWLRLYNGDFVRMLPWTVLMDDLTNQWSLEDAVKYVLKESYPNITIEELWSEYRTEVEAFIQNN
nr:basic secretory protein-like protein [uncultured Bacteroides sp.]